MTHIVKRRGLRQYETFSQQKLQNSIIAACRAVNASEGSAEITAKAVVEAVTEWLSSRPEVTSDDIRRVAARTLTIHNPDAAYYYTQHKHIV